MAAAEKYRICSMDLGKPLWVTGFNEQGVFTISTDVSNALTFDSFDKAHYIKAFLEACNPLHLFDMSRHISIPCRVASRPVTAQRSMDG